MNENEILIGVCGAHMSGLPLNWQLTDLNASFVKQSKTKKAYRLFVLENKNPIAAIGKNAINTFVHKLTCANVNFDG